MDSERNDDALTSEPGDHVYGKTPGAGDWKRIAQTVLLIALVVYTVLFFVNNNELTEVNFVFTTITVKLVWVLIGTFIVGAIVMYLILWLRGRRKRKAAKKKS